ncbi:response regulator transcription factor [Acidaminococcus timonensis]|uniref:response regulator transcription factor n=1 Tax=Acidaminococcus timonensis TaxID=1871002 RepID=UPI002941E7F1|nr:response regulator transcription factor [Acidaminococcus timonensis]
MQKILIIEDDMDIAELERDYMEANGFSVEIVGDGSLGEKRALEADVDLILLDIMLPGMDGFQVCRKVREARNIPILLVSARQEDVDKIRGLGLGADDYIVKPFSPSELVARVIAHLQRYLQLTGKKDAPHVFQRGALTIDRDGHQVFLDGREVPMPNKEFALLLFLAENPGVVFSKETLFERIWGETSLGDTATVSVHINRIREKIEPSTTRPTYIETVWGVGYRFKK